MATTEKKTKPKDLWKELQTMLNEFKSTLDPSKPFDPNDVIKKWKPIWNVLRKALEYTKATWLTGKKFDEKVQEIIDKGDAISDVQSLTDFLRAVKKVWDKVRGPLVPLSHTGKPDFQAAVQKFIAIMDWLVKAA